MNSIAGNLPTWTCRRSHLSAMASGCTSMKIHTSARPRTSPWRPEWCSESNPSFLRPGLASACRTRTCCWSRRMAAKSCPIISIATRCWSCSDGPIKNPDVPGPLGPGFRVPAEDVEFKRLNKRHGAIKLPKIGWVRFRGYRPLGGDLRSVTFRRKAGEWFVSVLWQKKRPDPSKSTDDPIGIDRGVAVFAATSVGQLIDPVNPFAGLRDKRAKLQQRLACKVKFSSNWHKLKGKISRLRMHEANVRKDFLHKEAAGLAKSHGVYRLEKLRVRNMTASAAGTVEEPGKNVAQKNRLNRSTLDQGWGMFAPFLSYKEQERGGRLEFTPAPYTSLRCPAPGCSHTHANNRPTRDWFCCEVCGYEGHADVVGAINVSQGRILPVEPPKRIRRRVGKSKPVEERVSHGA